MSFRFFERKKNTEVKATNNGGDCMITVLGILFQIKNQRRLKL